MTRIAFTFGLMLFVALIATSAFYYNKSLKIAGLEIQNRISEGKVVTYKNNEGHWVTCLQERNATIEELKHNLAVKEVGVKPRQVSSVSTNTTERVDTFFMPIKHDTAYIILNGVKTIDSVTKVSYKDAFYDINGVIFNNDLFRLNIKSFDSITQVVKRYKEGFVLLKPFKRWKYQQFVFSSNPNCKIKFSEYLKIK